MEKMIEQAGVNPKRVRLQWASASEAQLFADGVRTLVDQIKEIGPIERDWR